MLTHELQLRVRYGETDKMGYVYYGNYALYYEQGRVELLRSIGLSYKQMEDGGVMLPVLDLTSKFIRPARYDDLLTVRTFLRRMPGVKITFDYEIENEEQVLLNIGQATLVFYDINKNKPCMAPDYLLNALRPHFAH